MEITKAMHDDQYEAMLIRREESKKYWAKKAERQGKRTIGELLQLSAAMKAVEKVR